MKTSPSHLKPELPPMAEIAARLTAGETLATVAAEYDRTAGAVHVRLSRAGFTKYGVAVVKRVAADGLPTTGRPWHVPEWYADALCAQTDPEGFFPEKGSSSPSAKKTCAACPVRLDCLDYALRHDEYGIWGGLSEGERRALKKEAS